MNALRYGSVVLLLAIVTISLAAEPAATLDIRQAVPVDAHLAVYGRHNPERDYQREYLQDIWNTVQDERLVERVVELVTSNVSDEDLEQARSAFNELKAAVEPIDWQSVADCQEMVYAQVMEPPFTHHLLLMRMTPEDAAGCEAAAKNLFTLVERRSEGKVPVITDREGAVELTTLGIPREVPFRPTVARVDGVLLFSSSEVLIRRSVGMLLGSGELSKFDDPRLKEALAQLPEPEDALVFFDGRQLFTQLRKIGQFIRQQTRGDEEVVREVARWTALAERVIDEFAVIDYEVTSEYTEGYRNCSMSIGKMLPEVDDKLLARMCASGEPFEDWQRWVPAKATAYSLSTGVSLHPLYEFAEQIVREDIPEGTMALQQFEQVQDQFGVHLDADILQAFSGESVSITLPASSGSAMGGPDSVLALRCHKPDRIRQLLHQLVDALQQIPAVKAQQLALVKCDDLEGFEKLSLSTLAMFGAQPVIGFHEGWMIIGSCPAAVQQVLDTWSGGAPTVADSDEFRRFSVDIEGPVNALSYSNTAQSTHQAATAVRQAGAIAPMIIGMAGAQADPDELQPIFEALKLLPSIAKVIDKFDFLEARLTVTQAGSEPRTYVKRSVTLVRPPAESQPAAAMEPAATESQQSQ